MSLDIPIDFSPGPPGPANSLPGHGFQNKFKSVRFVRSCMNWASEKGV